MKKEGMGGYLQLRPELLHMNSLDLTTENPYIYFTSTEYLKHRSYGTEVRMNCVVALKIISFSERDLSFRLCSNTSGA